MIDVVNKDGVGSLSVKASCGPDFEGLRSTLIGMWKNLLVKMVFSVITSAVLLVALYLVSSGVENGDKLFAGCAIGLITVTFFFLVVQLNKTNKDINDKIGLHTKTLNLEESKVCILNHKGVEQDIIELDSIDSISTNEGGNGATLIFTIGGNKRIFDFLDKDAVKLFVKEFVEIKNK